MSSDNRRVCLSCRFQISDNLVMKCFVAFEVNSFQSALMPKFLMW